MTVQYNYDITDFLNDKIVPSVFTIEINNSAISGTISHINTTTSHADIFFNSALSTGDESVLDSLVAVHDGEPATRLELGPTSDHIMGYPTSQADPEPGHLLLLNETGDAWTSSRSVQNFVDLLDTPTTLSGHGGGLLRVNLTGSGIGFIHEHSHSQLVFTGHPNYNGAIRLLGWYIKTNDTPPNDGPYDLSSGNPIQALKAGYHSHWVMNIITVNGTPFTVNVSGTCVDESTGIYTEEDEDITVTGTGYYQSETSFMDTSTFSISEAGKSCTMDIYKTTYWDAGNRNFTLEGCRIEWEPDQLNWNFNLKIYHFHHDGSLHLVDAIDFDDTDPIPRAAKYEPGKYKRTDYNHFINGNNSEGLVLYLDQNSISNFYLELRYFMETDTI